MDERHDADGPDDAYSRLSRLRELKFLLEELHLQEDALEEEGSRLGTTRLAVPLRVRSALLAFAGVAILLMNALVMALVRWNLGSNVLVTILLLISVLVGLAFIVYAVLSAPSGIALRAQVERDRSQRLRLIKLRRMQIRGELDTLMDHTEMPNSDGVERV